MGTYSRNNNAVVRMNSSGFTLVEFVIAISLMVVVGFGASWTLGFVTQKQNSVLEANEELDYSREVRRAFKQTTQYTNSKGKRIAANVCKALLESKIELDQNASSWFVNYDPTSNDNGELSIDISDVNILGYKPNEFVTDNSTAFTDDNGKTAFRYGQLKISNQQLNNFVFLDRYQGKVSNDRNMVRVDGTTQTRTYSYFRGDFTYTISAGKSSGRVAKALSLYFLVIPNNGKISLVDCGTEVNSSLASMERFCQSLGKDFALGIGDPVASDGTTAVDDINQRMRCLAPIYDSKLQSKNPNQAINLTHYIPLQEVFCDFASRGYSVLGRFCIGEAPKTSEAGQ